MRSLWFAISCLILVHSFEASAESSGLATQVAELKAQIEALTTALNAEVAARKAGDTQTQMQLKESLNEKSLSRANAYRTLGGLATELKKNAEFSRILRQFIHFVPGPINGLAGPHIIFEGVNVHVRSGSGSTDDGCSEGNPACESLTGLGNLTVGYNEQLNASGDFLAVCSDGRFDTEVECESNGGRWSQNHRSGSHNLIVGSWNSYSSYGGAAIGQANRITASYASVTGGHENLASGSFASVTGGVRNSATGPSCAVSGGTNAVAGGDGSSVTGGVGNEAMGTTDSISGGADNLTLGTSSSISGGVRNTTTGLCCASILGGRNQTTTLEDQTIPALP